MAERTAVERTFAEAKEEQKHLAPHDPAKVQKICLLILVGLAVMYTLYFAQDVLLPVFLAFLLSLLLRGPVKALHRLKLAEPVAAVLVMLGLIGAVGAGVAAVAEPAVQWVERAPTVLAELGEKLKDLQQGLAQAREATQQLQQMTGADEQPTEVVVQGPNLADEILTQTQMVIAQTLLVIALTFFFLAFGRHTLESVIRSLPNVQDRLHLVDIVNTVQINISTYLLTVTGINLCLGIVAAGMFWLMDVPNPLLWGMVAGLLNFIPYLGSACTALILAVVCLLTFDDWVRMLAPPLGFMLLTAFEGNFITPTVIGKRLTLNPIFVFSTVLFWGWLWGVPGALLAVPILAVFKILCDATPQLRTLGALMG
ncbi:AI-2E family transporter [Indioceanicola profundi]|uniref:AI-2E family transporter n=1 Tax=Indioceanicola profundi TaxID=2220096 RepID=UPI000E6AAD73|nr:AI-2E family transporter [Indioceanicola profundi]